MAAAGNKLIKIFEVPSLNPSPTMIYDGHDANITAVGFNNESHWIYSCSEDTTIRIWDMRAKGF